MIGGQTADSSLRRNLLDIFALNALTIAQPLMNRLQSHASFLQIENLGLTAVLLTVAALMLFVPALALILQLIAGLPGASFRRGVHRLQVFILLTLLVMSVLTWASETTMLMGYGVHGLLRPFFAVPAAGVLIVCYVRRDWLREVLRYAAFASVLFPAAFFLSQPVRETLFSAPPPTFPHYPHAGSPAPILIVLFDGLSGTSLQNEEYQIDAARYPSFGRLAATSTWYRNATTVHYRTWNAVPAILTGCFLPPGLPPRESLYPVNLFRLIYESRQYSMTVFEPFTQMCPEQPGKLKSVRSIGTRTQLLLGTLAAVWCNDTIPRLLMDRISITSSWYGFARSQDVDPQATDGLIKYAWDTDRRRQFEHFIRCMQPGDKPAFRFLHVVIPHDPWTGLPSGNEYLWDVSIATSLLGTDRMNAEVWASDELAADRGWQRHLLQLQFADLWLGRIFDELQRTGQFDETLIVVMSDHGMSFVPGINRREPSADTLPDLAPIPLFIKLPNQSQGRISDRNVESIDVFPTIADVIDLELPDPTDGISILDESTPARPRKTLAGPAGEILMHPDFPEKERAVDRMLAKFGSGTSEDRLQLLNTRPELIGRAVNSMQRIDSRYSWTQLSTGGRQVAEERPHQIPCYLEGDLPEINSPERPVELAIAVNGVILATTRTFTDPFISTRWSSLLPEAAYQVGTNQIQIFEIIDGTPEPSLGQLQVRFAE